MISSFQLKGDVAAVFIVVLRLLGMLSLIDHQRLVLPLLFLVVFLLGLLLVVVLRWLLLLLILTFLLLLFLGLPFLSIGLLCTLLIAGLVLELEVLGEVTDLELHSGHLRIELLKQPLLLLGGDPTTGTKFGPVLP